MFIRLKIMQVFAIVFIVTMAYGIAFGTDPAQEAPPEIKKGAVTGRVMVKGKEDVPLSWGQIMFYNVSTGPPPAPEKYERTPDALKILDADGKFKVELSEGRYYIGAIKRISGDKLGPPQAGDYVFRSVDENHKPKEYPVKADQVLDVGTFADASPLSEEDILKRHVTTAIEGMIVSTDWIPVEGAVVAAFAEPGIRKKPLFVSNMSDKEGKYVLPVTEGTYYLRVRNSFAAGPPVPGEIVGYYGEGTPVPVPVKQCEILKGVDFQVVVFRDRGPEPVPAAEPGPKEE